eukprot:TRINITY_DN50017_c0_g1_i1.p1 TRINITY_DN50017_c0_g1~~TRINITY_DN50017_c0_g1_i1.p1  ORF type:complete len:417 (-),score=64.93 TRINITY_DN50017_c0_g1_i1:3-1253(-)
MVSHAPPPPSPMLSPGRQLYRPVPQSPVLTFRTSPGSAAVPVSSHMSLTQAAPAIAARHSKSTSDLSQTRRSRYDPARLLAGGSPMKEHTAKSDTSRSENRVSTNGAGTAAGNSPAQFASSFTVAARAGSPVPALSEGRRMLSAASPPATSRMCTPHSTTRSPTAYRGVSPGTGRTTPPPPWRHGVPYQSNSASAPSGNPVRSTSSSQGVKTAGGFAPFGGTQVLLSSISGSRPWSMSVSVGAQQPSSRHVSPGQSRLDGTVSQILTTSSATAPSGSSAAASSRLRRSSSRHGGGVETISPRTHVVRNQSTHSLSHEELSLASNGYTAETPTVRTAHSMSLPVANSKHHDGDSQVAHHRDSLLQHIHSVQREINRLQAEKQKQRQLHGQLQGQLQGQQHPQQQQQQQQQQEQQQQR